MSVLRVTVYITLLLAVVFLFCFVMETWRRKNTGDEQTSLLPLQDDETNTDS